MPILKININDNIYFFILTPYFPELQGLPASTDAVLQQELFELEQLSIQQTALITPHAKTPTNITFKANSMHSFQQLQFSHFIYYSFLIMII